MEESVRYLNQPWSVALAGLREPADLAICDPIYESGDLDWCAAASAVLRPGGTLYAFCDHHRAAEIRIALDACPDMNFSAWLVWPNDWGGRPRSRWAQKHDFILVYTRAGADATFRPERVQIPKKMVGASLNPSGRTTKTPPSVWSDIANYPTTAKERVRIDGTSVRWQKPLKVIRRIVLASSDPGDLVIDPFGGVATVPAVCLELDRRCLSAEIDPVIHLAGAERLDGVRVQLADT